MAAVNAAPYDPQRLTRPTKPPGWILLVHLERIQISICI